MIQKILAVYALASLTNSVIFMPVSAQSATIATPQASTGFFLDAKITSEKNIRIDKKAIFDASESVLSTSTLPAEYIWDFGTGPKIEGKEVVQSFSTIGKQTVTLTIRQAQTQASTQKDIFVFNKKALLIADQTNIPAIESIQAQAAENGIALELLPTAEKEGTLLTEDALVQKIKEATDYIKDSDILIFYTQSPVGLQAFNLYWRDLDPTTKELVKNKFFTVISDNNLDTAANLAYQTFNIIEPSYILLTRPEAINPIFLAKDASDITGILANRGIEYKIIDRRGEKSPLFVLSHFVTDLVSQGVSSNIIYIILIVPFLACIASIAKQVVGISAFGVYTPIIIAISFFILGLRLGIIAFICAVIIGYVTKYILNKFELLYLPKVALNLAFISLSFLFVIWLALEYGTSVPLSIAVFPMLVMSTVSEKFMAAQNEEGVRSALLAVAGTLFIVITSYYFVTWTYINNVLLAWPELVFVPILITIALGKFTGLRLVEYVRFRSLLTEHQEE